MTVTISAPSSWISPRNARQIHLPWLSAGHGPLKRCGHQNAAYYTGILRCGLTPRTCTHITRQTQDEAAQTMGTLMAQVR